LVLTANLDGEMGKLIAELNMQDLQGNTRAFKSRGIGLDVELKQARQAFNLKLSSPLAGSLDAQQVNLSNLVIALSASGDDLPNKLITSELKGSVQVDGERESVQVSLTGGLLQSQVGAKVAVKGFADPAIRFDVNVDQFDADLYLPKKTAAAPANQEATPEQPFDLSALQNLNINGSLRVGALKVANVKSTKLHVDVKANNGLVSVAPLAADLYRGSINGTIEVNASKTTPVFTIKQNMNGVQLGPLIKDALDVDMVEGGGNVNINLTTQGNTVTALKKALNGTLAFNLAEGAIKGIDLSKLVRGAQQLGVKGGVKTLKPSKDDKTAFSELQASFKVSNGVAHNDDLLVKAESLRVTGSGDVDLGNDSLDYKVKATLAETIDGKSSSLTVPVHLSGMFSELKYTVDYGAIIADLAKQKLENKQDEIKSKVKDKVQEKLKGGLKNLFK
jgi:AsmA protein